LWFWLAAMTLGACIFPLVPALSLVSFVLLFNIFAFVGIGVDTLNLGFVVQTYPFALWLSLPILPLVLAGPPFSYRMAMADRDPPALVEYTVAALTVGFVGPIGLGVAAGLGYLLFGFEELVPLAIMTIWYVAFGGIVAPVCAVVSWPLIVRLDRLVQRRVTDNR
jgi:hypothetical protein